MPVTFLLFICLFFGLYFVEKVKRRRSTLRDPKVYSFNLNYGREYHGKNP